MEERIDIPEPKRIISIIWDLEMWVLILFIISSVILLFSFYCFSGARICVWWIIMKQPNIKNMSCQLNVTCGKRKRIKKSEIEFVYNPILAFSSICYFIIGIMILGDFILPLIISFLATLLCWKRFIYLKHKHNQ